jgi:hypothetical protein
MTGSEREKVNYVIGVLKDLLANEIKSDSKYCVTNHSSYSYFHSFEDAVTHYHNVLTKVIACGQDVGEWRIERV